MTTLRIGLLFLLFGLSLAAQAPQIVAGPMQGEVTETSVKVWVQLDRPGKLMLEARLTKDASTMVAKSPAVTTSEANAHSVVLRLAGMAAGQSYALRLMCDGVAKPLTEFKVTTRAHWLFRDPGPPNFKIAFGSCVYINDERVDRKNQKPYGGGYEIFDALRASKPDYMLWIGDNTYFRAPDWSTREGMVGRYSYDRRVAPLAKFLKTTRHLAIWDDHDYGPNDSDWTFQGKTDAKDVFEAFWPNPRLGMPEAPGAFFKYDWGDASFFMLDNRSFRSANRAPKGPAKTMWGEVQLRWLLDALSQSPQRFKIVVNGNQMLNPLTPYEGLGIFPEERAHLLAEIEKRDIRGLVFLSGDRHHAELIKIPRKGHYGLYEFTSSPLTSGINKSRRELKNHRRVKGTLENERRNFGLLEFSGPRRKRTLKLSLHDPKGQEIWTHSLADKDLGW